MPQATIYSKAVTAEPIYSAFGDDPDLGEIVTMFVEEMPSRIDTLLDLLNRGDRELLGRFAHQLKGTAGSYGFDPITPKAARLEDSLRRNEPESEIYDAVQELAALCRSVRAGAPA
jgi:HPt (histidine-containing phosphotransfer) domain-containing protein